MTGRAQDRLMGMVEEKTWKKGCRDASASCGWIYRVMEEKMSFPELSRAWDRAHGLMAVNSARGSRA